MRHRPTGVDPSARVGWSGGSARRPVRYPGLDPMVATGGSMTRTVDLLVARGATDVVVVCVVVTPEGTAALKKSGHPVRVVTAAIDDELNDHGIVVPGLGDAGDRQYGPR